MKLPVFQAHRFLTSLSVAAALALAIACSSSSEKKEYMWVSAPQVGLRDRIATLYNKTGIVHNAERVEVVERQKRFARVRTKGGEEGWIELRYLVDQRVYNGFQQMVKDARWLPVVGVATTRSSTNMHLTPARDAEVLYQMHEGEKIEILKRAVSPRPQPPGKKPDEPPTTPTLAKTAATRNGARRGREDKSKESGPILEDWWLIRNTSGQVGWVLGRMLDLDVPLDIAQYAEGQRIVACALINTVQDEDKRVGQWLALVTDPKDGLPYDFNQIRVFTWNLKKHRYETAYRERKLFGMLPVKVDRKDFGKEAMLPVFSFQVQDANGQTVERTYRLAGTMVRRVIPDDQKTGVATANQNSATAPARHSHRRRS